MPNFYIKWVIACVLLQCTNIEAHVQYTAQFSATDTDGFAGSYVITIDEDTLTAVHDFSINTTAYNGSCDLSAGLKYHIHGIWADGASGSNCGADYTGGHYDPYLACGSATEETEICAVVHAGDTYVCNATSAILNTVKSCELGDTSGIFGLVYPNSNGVLEGDSLSQFFPPAAWTNNIDFLTSAMSDYTFSYTDFIDSSYVTYLLQTTGDIASMVFHCTDPGTRLFCAELVATEDYNDQSSSTTSSDDSDDSSAADLSISPILFLASLLITLRTLV